MAVDLVVTATKQVGQVSLYEVDDLPTSTRVFAAYQRGMNLGFLTVDDRTNTIELVYVPSFLRGRGIATVLLDFARETTGLSLDRDTGERTLDGSRWTKKRGIKVAPGRKYHRLAKGDIAQQIVALTSWLYDEPES